MSMKEVIKPYVRMFLWAAASAIAIFFALHLLAVGHPLTFILAFACIGVLSSFIPEEKKTTREMLDERALNALQVHGAEVAGSLPEFFEEPEDLVSPAWATRLSHSPF
jgi:hypothetical protein